MKVVVHCIAGISRSASICAAYLIKHRGMSAIEALEFVRSRRRMANPNAGFIGQLGDWEEDCKASA